MDLGKGPKICSAAYAQFSQQRNKNTITCFLKFSRVWNIDWIVMGMAIWLKGAYCMVQQNFVSGEYPTGYPPISYRKKKQLGS